MIVVAIIGVLCMIGIPAFSAARSKTQLEMCRNNQRVMFEQLNIFCLERGVTCTVDVFPNLCAVRDALVPLGAGAKYIKTRRVFACPANPDQTIMHDYEFVRDGRRIIDFDCSIVAAHNL